MKIGYSVAIKNMTPEKLAYAKFVGVDYIETSLQAFINADTRTFNKSDEEIRAEIKKAKAIATAAGIEIWSIHMPYGETIDISLADEKARQEVVALHKKILEFCQVLEPKIILFHPSYFLGLNEREVRKSQMIKSSVELVKAVHAIKADMVIENMLGPQVKHDAARERPLCRSVEETMEIMSRLPDNIYAAVDMNHIKNPENLIKALGNRVKSVHIADGHGEKENHFFPCTGQGGNNWVAILDALHEAGYTGPFLYESAGKDVKELKECYLTLYNNWIAQKAIIPAK